MKNREELHFGSWETIKRKIKLIDTDQVIFMIDRKVYNLYHSLFDEFPQENIFVAGQGEASKSRDCYDEAMDYFLNLGVHRRAHLVAIGGGALSDMAGFVAATLLRGIPWSIVPTTLLAMVDACCGGKVGINSLFGKNLIGSFWRPQNVFIDTNFLNTLPQQEVHSGKGEILKYALLNKEIYELVQSPAEMNDIIAACLNYKQTIVDCDFHDNGQRKILNYGHTFGHAFEKNRGLPHGLAIVKGMLFIDSLCQESRLAHEIRDLAQKLMIPIGLPEEINDSDWQYILRDKKKTSQDCIELVILKSLGEVEVKQYSLKELRSEMEKNEN